MRLLFELDAKNYKESGSVFKRDSARAIIIKNGKIYMVHSLMYDYYKFPGGGIEKGETREEAVIRETLEEAGLRVKKESIKEYGYVHRIQQCNEDDADIFIQDNFYYLCEIEDEAGAQNLDGYEAFEKFTLECIDYKTAVNANRTSDHGPKDLIMIEREARVLELLANEGYLY